MHLFNKELISTIEHRIPKKNDQLHFLMDVLEMGKETAYRRLRGDVPFTFGEACLIVQKMGISLDKLIKIDSSSKPVFEVEISPDSLNEYAAFRLLQHDKSYENFKSIPNLTTNSACNMIPYTFLLSHENLYKMFIFRLSYLIEYHITPIKFANYIIAEDLNKKRKELARKYADYPEFTFIFDRNIFSSYINEIKHFWGLGLISNEEKQKMKEEFYGMLSDIELLAAHGRNKCGSKTWFYLSNIDFNSNYSYVKGDNFERAYMDGIYLMDTISSSDPRICKMHRDWIESLKKYSTLISVSGEMERRIFFDSQREILSTTL